MKKLLILLLFSSSVNAVASPAHCFADLRILNLNREQAIKLCKGSDSAAPVDCFEDFSIFGLSGEDKIKLCAGATKLYSPAECYNDSLLYGVNTSDRINLCSKY